jgi:hypothetical protein
MSERNEQRCKFFREEDDHHPKFESNVFPGKAEFASQYFYCIKTMTVSGPDYEPVGPEECKQSRKCFVTE